METVHFYENKLFFIEGVHEYNHASLSFTK